jgi:diguanylate cyclase (GGDEF)-like protein/PAS domain S-box-containing protein
MASTPPDPAWFQQVVEELPDTLVAVDASGTIVYVNKAAERIASISPQDLVGENLADWLHPDDLDRALEVVGLMLGGEFENQPVTPALYRVRAGDGRWIPVEINGGQLSSPDRSGDILAVCRFSGDRLLHEEVYERLTRGESTVEVVALVPMLGAWRHPTERYAVALTDDDGVRVAPGGRLPVELAGCDLSNEKSPWARALATRDEVVLDDLDSFPPEVRALAEHEGLRACKVVPVPEPDGSVDATITIWASNSGPPWSMHTYALADMRRVLALILRWRDQVRRLEEASFTDHLTGVASRSRFFRALEPRASGELAAILYVDLDRFKPVNDRYGHRTGDEVLVIVAQRLKSAVRPTDLVARIGGDEFAVLCLDLKDISDVTTVAERIVQSIGRPIDLNGVEITVEASVGIASTTEMSLDGDLLLDEADRALYRAKREGRGRWALA